MGTFQARKRPYSGSSYTQLGIQEQEELALGVACTCVKLGGHFCAKK